MPQSKVYHIGNGGSWLEYYLQEYRCNRLEL